ERGAQDVEVVGRRGAVGDLPVILCAQLQVALEPRRGVLWPLTFIAMREQADETRHPQPLALAGRDELVEYDLRAVGEIAELRLPHHEGVWLGQRVAVFEGQHRLLRAHRVDRFKAAMAWGDVFERGVAALGLLVDQHRMTLRESPPLAVLA